MKARDLISADLEMRNAYENAQYSKVIDLLDQKLNVGVVGHGLIKAKALLALGQTNEAFNVAWKSYESRIFFAKCSILLAAALPKSLTLPNPSFASLAARCCSFFIHPK